jgi:hypothetical protein
VAAVLPHRHRREGAALDHTDEDHDSVWEDTVLALNGALIAKAVEAKLVKTGIVRADTTVVSGNVKYPTDSGLLV